MIRVLVVDDDPLVCAQLRGILELAPDIDIVDAAHDGAEAIDAVTRLRPDLVLMDLRMPGIDGVAATRHITALPDPPFVVMLTTFDADNYVLGSLQAGANGFLLKSTPPEELIGLVRVAADGHSVFSSAATQRLLNAAGSERSARQDVEALVENLTDREIDVLACLGEGMTNADIALRLRISETTVKGHVSRILLALGCANRTQAGLLAQHIRLEASRRGGP